VLDINSKQKNSERPENPLRRFLGRSLFAKYFTACAAIMVASFLVLGTALILVSVNYSNSEEERSFLYNARQLSDVFVSTQTNLKQLQRQFSLSQKDMKPYTDREVVQALQPYAFILDAVVYVCDGKGKLIFVVSANSYDDSPSGTVGSSVISRLKKGQSVDDGSLGGLFDRNYICAGVPLNSINQNADYYSDNAGTFEGGIFIRSTGTGLLSAFTGIFNIFIFCVGFILIFAFIAIYFMTSRLVRPLHQMSSAAKSFAKGDFSARVPVGSQDEIGQLAVAFNNMASSLTSLEEMRSSFVANVSHELKTPMTSISGFIDGILDGTIPREKENHYLSIVSDEVKRLSRLVRSFLDIARIEAGEYKFNPTDFDVMELVRRVIVGFEQLIDGKALDIRGLDNDDVFTVHADFDMTYQTVYNLVDNAVKFANQGGFIEINIAAKGKKVYVSVKNSGMGIPEADLPYVFDRFYKTDKSRSRDRKGVGLGLYIVKTVLNMQGEDITVKSVEGQFCEFVFTLREV
jgi:Signal transduction histidine kinase